jgi:hypothetical protein
MRRSKCCVPSDEEGSPWLSDDGDRWRAYFDTDDKLVFYCPKCGEREFDESPRGPNQR